TRARTGWPSLRPALAHWRATARRPRRGRVAVGTRPPPSAMPQASSASSVSRVSTAPASMAPARRSTVARPTAMPQPCPRRAAAQVIEAGGGGDAEQPRFGVGAAVLVGALDGTRQRLLCEVVGLAAAAGHAVAQRPDAPAVAQGGGEQRVHPASIPSVARLPR